jgi:circadian clock protein KaiC
METKETVQVEKLKTGIAGFDFISNGGLSKSRVTLVSGSAGSAKTVFAAQFLVEGIRQAGECGVFVTFEESPADIRNNMAGFSWEIEAWEQAGKWVFVDASPQPGDEAAVTGAYDMGALLARIEHAVRKVGAARVSIDSLGAIFSRFLDAPTVRQELFRITLALKQMGVTAVLTAECPEDYGQITRYGVEEFVADNVILLRNVLEEEKRRRSIEILKFRGTSHQKGEFPFTVLSGEGLIVIPLAEIQLEQKSSDIRITSGNEELDELCGGGFFRDSIILV